MEKNIEDEICKIKDELYIREKLVKSLNRSVCTENKLIEKLKSELKYNEDKLYNIFHNLNEN
jgi:hypothetical protein